MVEIGIHLTIDDRKAFFHNTVSNIMIHFSQWIDLIQKLNAKVFSFKFLFDSKIFYIQLSM